VSDGGILIDWEGGKKKKRKKKQSGQGGPRKRRDACVYVTSLTDQGGGREKEKKGKGYCEYSTPSSRRFDCRLARIVGGGERGKEERSIPPQTLHSPHALHEKRKRGRGKGKKKKNNNTAISRKSRLTTLIGHYFQPFDRKRGEKGKRFDQRRPPSKSAYRCPPVWGKRGGKGEKGKRGNTLPNRCTWHRSFDPSDSAADRREQERSFTNPTKMGGREKRHQPVHTHLYFFVRPRKERKRREKCFAISRISLNLRSL